MPQVSNFSSVSHFDQEGKSETFILYWLLNLPRGSIDSSLTSSNGSGNQMYISETIKSRKGKRPIY